MNLSHGAPLRGVELLLALMLLSCSSGTEEPLGRIQNDDGALDAGAAIEPTFACEPTFLGSMTGVLVPAETPFPAPEALYRHSCDSESLGQIQYSWQAPEAGCFQVSTLLFGPYLGMLTTLKVRWGTCDGDSIYCSKNYGSSIPIFWLESGEFVTIGLTALENESNRNQTLKITRTRLDHDACVAPSERASDP